MFKHCVLLVLLVTLLGLDSSQQGDSVWHIRIVDPMGASVRFHPDERSGVLRTLSSGTMVEASDRWLSGDGLASYKLADGWLQSTNGVQVESRPEAPFLLKVVAHDGADVVLRNLPGLVQGRGIQRADTALRHVPYGELVESFRLHGSWFDCGDGWIYIDDVDVIQDSLQPWSRYNEPEETVRVMPVSMSVSAAEAVYTSNSNINNNSSSAAKTSGEVTTITFGGVSLVDQIAAENAAVAAAVAVEEVMEPGMEQKVMGSEEESQHQDSADEAEVYVYATDYDYDYYDYEDDGAFFLNATAVAVSMRGFARRMAADVNVPTEAPVKSVHGSVAAAVLTVGPSTPSHDQVIRGDLQASGHGAVHTSPSTVFSASTRDVVKSQSVPTKAPVSAPTVMSVVQDKAQVMWSWASTATAALKSALVIRESDLALVLL
jgi:hypothetical protein